jgi:pimeloyl-ACP methyl ester carboxylesterase
MQRLVTPRGRMLRVEAMSTMSELPAAVGRSRKVELEGRTLALVEYGAAEGPTLLCLHGWLDNAASFAPLAAQLGSYRWLALELAGHGESDARAVGATYHQLDYVIDVLEAIEALGLERPVLVGHSMGAGVASLVAGMLAEQARGLVLIEGTAPRVADPDAVPAILTEHLNGRRAARARITTPRSVTFDVAVRARVMASSLSHGAAVLLAQRGTLERDGGYVWRSDKRLQQPGAPALSEAAIQAFLRRIRCPVLAVYAEDGLKPDPLRLAQRVACIANFTRTTLPGKHHVHMDNAPDVAAVLAPFLESVR